MFIHDKNPIILPCICFIFSQVKAERNIWRQRYEELNVKKLKLNVIYLAEKGLTSGSPNIEIILQEIATTVQVASVLKLTIDKCYTSYLANVS